MSTFLTTSSPASFFHLFLRRSKFCYSTTTILLGRSFHFPLSINLFMSISPPTCSQALLTPFSQTLSRNRLIYSMFPTINCPGPFLLSFVPSLSLLFLTATISTVLFLRVSPPILLFLAILVPISLLQTLSLSSMSIRLLAAIVIAATRYLSPFNPSKEPYLLLTPFHTFTSLFRHHVRPS